MNFRSPLESRTRRVAELCFAIPGAMAVLVLLSWASGQWQFLTFGSDYAPMAPRTALCLLALSGAAWLRLRRPSSAIANRLGSAAALAVLAVCLLTLANALFGIELELPLERGYVAALQGYRLGAMSPVTAAIIAMACLAFLRERSPNPLQRQPRQTAALLSLTVLLCGLAVVHGYAMGVPTLYGVGVPVAALTGVAFVLVGLGLLLTAGTDVWPVSLLDTGSSAGAPSTRLFPSGFATLTLLLAAGIIVSGYFYFRRAQVEIHSTASKTLAIIADGKARQVANWYAGLQRDARLVSTMPTLADDFARFRANRGDEPNRLELLAWLATLRSEFDEARATLYDAEGVVQLSVPPDPAPGPSEDAAVVRRVARTGTVIEDLHRDGPGRPIHLDVLVPIGTSRQSSGGVLAFRIDPFRSLFPLVVSWPVPSSTAETMLVRREGDEVVYLSELLHFTDAALNKRVRIDRTSRPPEVVTALQQDGEIAGVDYRGVPVLAALRTVAGTPWTMVAKIDQEETDGPLRRQAATTTFIGGSLILAIAFGLNLARSRKDLGAARREVALLLQREAVEESLRSSEKRYERVVRGTSDGLWERNLLTGETYLSPRWKELLGFADDELPNSMDSFYSRVHPDDLAGVQAASKAHLERRVPYDIELRLRTKRGEYRWFRSRGLAEWDEEGRPTRMSGAITDVTARKQADKALRDSEERFRAAVEQAAVGITETELDGRFLVVNHRFCDLLGYTRDELLGLTFQAITHPDDLTADLVGSNRILSGESATFSMEKRYIRKDGSLLWVNLAVSLVRDEAGSPGHFISMVQDVTERKAAEQSLRDSEEKFAAAFQASPVAISLSALADGTYVDVNETFLTDSGYTREELIGRTSIELGIFPDRSARERLVAEVLERGVVRGRETQLRRKSGEIVDYLFSTALVTLGGRRCLLSSRLNITERKRAEEALRRTTRTVRMTGAAAEALVRAQSEQELLDTICLLMVEDGGYRLAWVGFPEGDAEQTVRPAARAGSSADYLDRAEVSQADGEWIDGPAHLAISTSQPAVTHYPQERNVAGIPGIASSVALPLLDRDRVLGVLVVYSDQLDPFDTNEIDLLKRLAGELTFGIGSLRANAARGKAVAQLERFRALMDRSNDAVFIVEPSTGALVDFNATACQRTGYGRDELLRLRVWDLEGGIPEPAKAWAEAVRTLQGRTHLAWEGSLRCQDGTLIPTEVDASFIKQEEGELVLAVSRDITARRQAEAERAELQAQLQQAQKMESIGRLAGGIAHDFNNLLTAIMGYGELLDRQLPADSLSHRDLNEILLAGKRAAALTRQLLSFSRKQLLQPSVLDLSSVVAATSSMLQRLIGENIELSHAADSRLWRVSADPDQIAQVLMNLAVNARDAMPDGGRLIIETRNVGFDETHPKPLRPAARGQYVMVAVTDTGTGMDAQTQSHLFEPFFTTKERGEGTGLGLSTVHGIVQQSGGFIHVDSEPGRGSRFEIYLPRVTELADARRTRRETGEVPRGHETVLVAEDERAVRTLIRVVLEECGYSVLMAPDGETALQTAQDHSGQIDLLLSDIIMPGMNGVELAGRLKTLRPSIRVLFSTGYTAPAVTKNISGEDALLRKPFSPDGLARAVRSALDGKPTRRT